jgi:MFS family permease
MTRPDWRGQVSPHWMNRDVELLIAARVCMSSGRALAGVLVPIYLAKIGFSGGMLGVLFAVTGVVSALLTGAVAFLSDRFGRKTFIIALPLVAAGSAVVFALTRNTALVFAFAAAGSFGRSGGAGGGAVGPYLPAEQAYLADSVGSTWRNSLFGRVAFASSLGALIGVGVLAWIPDAAQATGMSELDAYRPAFIALSIVSLAAGLLPLTISPQRVPVPKHRGGISLPQKSWPVLIKLWVVNSILGLAFGFYGPFITYWLYRRYGAGPGMVGALYAFINVAGMFGNLGAAGAARRLGVVKTIVVTRVVGAILIFPMVLAPFFWLAGAVYLIRMVVMRMGMPLRQSYVMGVVPQEERAVVSGLSRLPTQATSAATPPLAGYVFDNVSMSLPFELGSIIQVITAGVYWMFFRNLRPPEEALRVVETAAAPAKPKPDELGATGQ